MRQERRFACRIIPCGRSALIQGGECCYAVLMHPALLHLLDTQQRDGFPDLRGSEAVLTIPLSDRLVNEAIAAFLPAGGKVREVTVQLHDANRMTVKIRATSSFLPAIPVGLEIEKQPALPDDPILTLKLANASKFVTLAASTLPAMVKLPPGIIVIGDRIRIDVRRLLSERHLDSWLAYISELRIGTREGALVLHVRATIR